VDGGDGITQRNEAAATNGETHKTLMISDGNAKLARLGSTLKHSLRSVPIDDLVFDVVVLCPSLP